MKIKESKKTFYSFTLSNEILKENSLLINPLISDLNAQMKMILDYVLLKNEYSTT